MTVVKRKPVPDCTEGDIQDLVYRYGMSRGWRIMIPNCSTITGWECDLLAVTKGGRLHDFEIKVDIADLRAEMMASMIATDPLIGAAPRVSAHKVYRHQALAGVISDDARWGRFAWPTYFWLAVTADVAERWGDLTDLPDYAGVAVCKGCFLHVVRDAPRLRCGTKLRAHHYESLASGLSGRYWENRLRR